MKISKLLKMLMGLGGWFSLGIVDSDGGGNSGPLDAFGAADAFSSLLGSEAPAESESQNDDSPEAAAERLAKQDLSGEGDPKEGDDDTPAPTDITVEIDGKKVTLTAEQIAENYKDGLRQKDYTQKTMAAAEVVKTAEAETAKARQERDSYAQKLNHFAISTNAAMQELAGELTQELLVSDPVEYLTKERIFKERQAQLGQAQQELLNIEQQQRYEQAEAGKKFVQDQHHMLVDKLPEWKDPAKMKAGMDALEPFLAQRGFTAQDGKMILDARILLMANDAKKYHDLMERAGKAVKKVAALPAKVERSGNAETSKPDGRTEAMKRLGRTGSINDAAAAFGQIL